MHNVYHQNLHQLDSSNRGPPKGFTIDRTPIMGCCDWELAGLLTMLSETCTACVSHMALVMPRPARVAKIPMPFPHIIFKKLARVHTKNGVPSIWHRGTKKNVPGQSVSVRMWSQASASIDTTWRGTDRQHPRAELALIVRCCTGMCLCWP